MTYDVAQAIVILNTAGSMIEGSSDYRWFERIRAQTIITHAIRYLAYPDRDRYPKSRRGTKRNPVEGRLHA